MEIDLLVKTSVVCNNVLGGKAVYMFFVIRLHGNNALFLAPQALEEEISDAGELTI